MDVVSKNGGTPGSTTHGASNVAQEPSAIEVAMCVAVNVEHLPAVATLDWCDRAADCVTSGLCCTVVAVLIGTLADSGKLTHMEASGTSARIDSASASASAEKMNVLRSDIEFVHSLPAVSRDGTVHSLHTLLGANWRESRCVQAFREFSPGDVALTVHQIPGASLGRCVITLVAFIRSGEEIGATRPVITTNELELLQTTNLHLAQKAAVAIGVQRSTRGRWISEREREVLDRLVLGMSVRQIAEELGRSTHTVHDHVKSLHKKLGASSRGELVARALGHLGACSGTSVTTLKAMPGCAIEPSRPMIDISQDIAREIAQSGPNAIPAGLKAKRLP